MRIPDFELIVALTQSDKIIQENENAKQEWLNGISQQKMVIVPISVLRTLHDQAQIEAINRNI
jgi:hypothetical protein